MKLVPPVVETVSDFDPDLNGHWGEFFHGRSESPLFYGFYSALICLWRICSVPSGHDFANGADDRNERKRQVQPKIRGFGGACGVKHPLFLIAQSCLQFFKS